MKYNKKLLGIVSAFAIAIPMSLGSVLANGTVDFTKTSSQAFVKHINAIELWKNHPEKSGW